MIAIEELAEVFVEVADTLVVDFDIVDFLQMVTTRSADMTRAEAAGLLLANERNQLHFMAASQESVKLLELFQLQSEEGPCLDCFRYGAPVSNADLSQATERWPRFAPEAVRAGYIAVHAFPLRHRNKVIGALNLFSTTKAGSTPTTAGSSRPSRTSRRSASCSSGRSSTARSSPSSSRSRCARASPSSRPRGTGAHAWRFRGRGVRPDADARPPEPPPADGPGHVRDPRPVELADAVRHRHAGLADRSTRGFGRVLGWSGEGVITGERPSRCR